MNTTQRERLSACIITYNEADRIEACVKSLSFCDDIVVVDSHSTDATREIAASLGVRVIERDWSGYKTQKDFAVRSAQHDWVLCLDADEQVSDELRTEILALRDRGFPDHAGWLIPRLMIYFGRYLKHGTAYPDRLIRLFDRRRGGWVGREIHENTRVSGPVGRLSGHLLHNSYRNLHDQENRLRRYADLMARALYEGGDRGGLVRLFLNPYWRFIRGYFLRLGFLDGWRGLVFALLESNYVRQKYIKLYLLTKGQTV